MKDTAALVVLWSFILTMPAAWMTHVIVSISEQAWGFLIAGAIMFPIAIVHGIGIWFGAW